MLPFAVSTDMTFRRIAYTMGFLCLMSSRISAQNTSAALNTDSSFHVPVVFSGEEPRFKDIEGSAFGPTKYVFHFLPGGKAFFDWSRPQAAKTGRTFGIYVITHTPKGVEVKTEFIPSMDSAATEPPATDYFETVVIRFANREIHARFVDDPNSPTFRLSRLGIKKR
jgi:hypothetical protein